MEVKYEVLQAFKCRGQAYNENKAVVMLVASCMDNQYQNVIPFNQELF